MATTIRTKSEAANREARRKQVAANLLAGLTYRQMAEALGVSLGTITKDVRLIIDHWRKEQVEDVDGWMQVQLRRLDTMLKAIWNDVLNGDLKAADTALRIIERQSKLLGLDRLERSIVDWREEAQNAGINPDAAYQQAVAAIVADLTAGARPDASRSVDRSAGDV